nr:MAG TPA: hypothetical protein [Caudoviricetes sp.]
MKKILEIRLISSSLLLIKLIKIVLLTHNKKNLVFLLIVLKNSCIII